MGKGPSYPLIFLISGYWIRSKHGCFPAIFQVFYSLTTTDIWLPDISGRYFFDVLLKSEICQICNQNLVSSLLSLYRESQCSLYPLNKPLDDRLISLIYPDIRCTVPARWYPLWQRSESSLSPFGRNRILRSDFRAVQSNYIATDNVFNLYSIPG